MLTKDDILLIFVGVNKLCQYVAEKQLFSKSWEGPAGDKAIGETRKLLLLDTHNFLRYNHSDMSACIFMIMTHNTIIIS